MTNEIQKTETKHNNGYVLVPPVDIYENENEYVIKADMPDVKKEDVDITYHNNTLEIKGAIGTNGKSEDLKYGEYTLYNYQRAFEVGNNIDGEKITANIENGVLTVLLPKREESKPRKIAVSVN